MSTTTDATEQQNALSLQITVDVTPSTTKIPTPTLIGSWNPLGYAFAVTVMGDYAYAVGDTFNVIDISDPSNPVFVSNYDIGFGWDIEIVGNTAYVANHDYVCA